MNTTNDRPHQQDPLIGTVFAGRYKIERRLGRGGMGLVYRATQTDLNRKIVLKVLAPDWIGDPEALARFEREARGLSSLQHPNIVAIYDYGSFDGRAYIVMEYVAGETLERFVKRKGALALGDFVPIAAQVLKGLGEAHSRGIIHRDIKPANIMLCERQGRANYVKILDFGLAKLVSGSSDITKQNVLGTPTCLSPEQIKGEKLDQRVDVYAVGILFYYMLAGQVPFSADNDASILYKHVHEEPEPLIKVLPAGHQVPDGVTDLIQRCLQKSPSRRPRDANEVVEGLIDQVPFSMFKLPRAEPKVGPSEDDLDEPYEEPTGEHSGQPIPGPQDIQVGTFGRSAELHGPVATTGPQQTQSPSMLTPLSPSQQFAAQSVQSALGHTTGSMGVNPLGPAGVTGAHPSMLGAMNTYPPGAFAALEQPVDRSRSPTTILFAVVAVLALLVLGYLALAPREAVNQPDPNPTSDQGSGMERLQSVIIRAENLIDRKQFGQAMILLDSATGDFARYPELMERVAALKDQIEIGRLLDAARVHEDAGDKEAALKAYREVLARNSGSSEARERIAALSGGAPDAGLGLLAANSSPPGGTVYVDDPNRPFGTTPLDAKSLPIGDHQITILLDGHLPWKKTVKIEAGKTFPINAVLTARSGSATTTAPTTPTKTKKPSTPKTSTPKTSTPKTPATTKTTPTPTPTKTSGGGMGDGILMPVGKKK